MLTIRLCQVHGEVTDPDIDIFDREKAFIDAVLIPLIKKLPDLKIVMEHITTADAVKFVESCKGLIRLFLDWSSCILFLQLFFLSVCLYFTGSVAATVTPQHLILNRNAIFQGGLQPHNYCLPVLKRETHSMFVMFFLI